MDEVFTRQPDGREVAGPTLDLGPPDTGASLGKWVTALVGVTCVLAAGVFLGRATVNPPTPTWQELVEQRVYDGCIPTISIIGVGPTAQTDQIDNGLVRTAGYVRASIPDARSMETHIWRTPAGSRLLEVNPRAEVVGAITLERCL